MVLICLIYLFPDFEVENFQGTILSLVVKSAEWCWILVSTAGGESTADNCQILQTRVNRFKSDKEKVDPTLLKGYSCAVEFTGIFASFCLPVCCLGNQVKKI